MKSLLNITKPAGKQLLRIAKENNVNNILFFVKGGGCNGFNYQLTPTEKKPEKLDEVVPYENINVIVDRHKCDAFVRYGNRLEKNGYGRNVSFYKSKRESQLWLWHFVLNMILTYFIMSKINCLMVHTFV